MVLKRDACVPSITNTLVSLLTAEHVFLIDRESARSELGALFQGAAKIMFADIPSQEVAIKSSSLRTFEVTLISGDSRPDNTTTVRRYLCDEVSRRVCRIRLNVLSRARVVRLASERCVCETDCIPQA